MFVLGSTVSVYANETNEKDILTSQTSNGTNLADVSIVRNTSSENIENEEVEVFDIGERSATLVWSDKDESQNYSIEKFNEETKKLENYAVTSDTEITLTNLNPNTNYRFTIKVRLSDKILGSVEFKTIQQTPVMSVSDYASDFVLLSFDNMEDGSTVELYGGTSSDNMSFISETTDSEYKDTAVSSGRTYYYSAKITAPNGKVTECDTVDVTTPISMGLPSVSGATKTYAYYTAVTVKSSPQYKLLNSSSCYTDPDTGIRMVDGCYCVALGSYYGSTIGTKYRVTFSTGNSIKVILCDQKADVHTDSNNQYALINSDIIEFYVQKSMIPSSIRGDYGNLSQFSGSIVSIEKYI